MSHSRPRPAPLVKFVVQDGYYMELDHLGIPQRRPRYRNARSPPPV